jgi:hypothetical protein
MKKLFTAVLAVCANTGPSSSMGPSAPSPCSMNLLWTAGAIA